jgi:hypothetical protein
MMPNAAGSMMESATRKMTIPSMGSHPIARIQRHNATNAAQRARFPDFGLLNLQRLRQ